MVIIPDHLLEIYGGRDKNDPSVTASCIQELQAKLQKEELRLARLRDNMEGNFQVLFNPDHEDYIICVQRHFNKFARELGRGGNKRRTLKTWPEKGQWVLDQAVPRVQEKRRWLQKLKDDVGDLKQVLDAQTLEDDGENLKQVLTN